MSTSAFGSPRGPPSYAMCLQLLLNLDLLTQALLFPRHDTTAHVEPEVWVKVSCQDIPSLTACCWPVAWPGPQHKSSLHQEDWFKMDQSIKNLSTLNLPKKGRQIK